MGYSPGVGLILGLGLDPSGANAGVKELGSCLGQLESGAAKSGEGMTESFAATDRALLSNRETARLLSEELGIHLPRAVTSAISKMLPEIATFGTALLGIFAVEEAYKWGKVVNQEFFQIYTQGDQIIKDLEAAATAAFKHAGEEAANMLTHFKTSLAGTFDIAQIDARVAQLERFHAAYQSLVGKMGTELIEAIAKVAPTITEATAQGLLKLEDVDKKIAEMGQLQFDAHKHMAEVITKEDKDSAEAAKRAGDAAYHAAVQKYEANQKAFHASEEALRHEMALQDQLGRKAVEEAVREEKAREHTALAIRRLTEELRRQHEQEARNAEHLAKEAAREIADVSRIRSDQERQMLRGHAEARQRIEEQHREAVASIQAKNQEAQAIAALEGDYKAMADAAIAAYTAMGQASQNYLKQLKEQTDAEREAAQAQQESTEDKIKGMAAEIGTFVGAVAGRKAEAEVEGAFFLAEGSFDLARGIWPPNPELIARGLGEIGSGINMLKVAGKSGTQPSIGGGGGVGAGYGIGGGHGGYGGGGGEDEHAIAGTGLAPGAAGSNGGRLNVYVIGDEAAFIAERVNNADRAGHFMQVTSSRRSSPSQG
jgi:hypothetical protein